MSTNSCCSAGPRIDPEIDEATEDLLQSQHLGHFRAMKDAGHLRVAGPLDEQPDDNWRGICLYQVGSLSEAPAAGRARSGCARRPVHGRRDALVHGQGRTGLSRIGRRPKTPQLIARRRRAPRHPPSSPRTRPTGRRRLRSASVGACLVLWFLVEAVSWGSLGRPASSPV